MGVCKFVRLAVSYLKRVQTHIGKMGINCHKCYKYYTYIKYICKEKDIKFEVKY